MKAHLYWPGGGRTKNCPRRRKFFFQPQNLSPPNPVYKNFYPRGPFSTLTPHCPHFYKSFLQNFLTFYTCPRVGILLRRLHRISMEAAPATMARRGQSHAPNPTADSRSAGFQAQQHHLSDALFTCICT